MNEEPQVFTPRSDESASQLVREALDDMRVLARAEVQLAKEDVREDLRRVEGAAIGFGAAAACALLVLVLLIVALVLAIGPSAIAALLVAAGFLGLGVVAGAVGYAAMPRKPLDRTRQRLGTDVRELKEHAV
jgi:hypothetical protein